jgi:hypothetical protein
MAILAKFSVVIFVILTKTVLIVFLLISILNIIITYIIRVKKLVNLNKQYTEIVLVYFKTVDNINLC